MLSRTSSRLGFTLLRSLVEGKPYVPLEHMRPVVGAFLVEQLCFRFPIEPSVIEWPVGVANETSPVRPAAPEQRVAHLVGVEPCCALHHAWIEPRDFFMAQSCVKVIGDASFEPVEIGIDEKPVAAGLDAGKRRWKQIGQRRPVEPSLADRRRLERQAKSQIGLKRRIVSIDFGSVETVQ